MAITTTHVLEAAGRWGLTNISPDRAAALADYGNLLLHWNTRLSLTAIRDENDLTERHLMEGAFAAANSPGGASALDFGSGTGIPGIPLALLCPDLRVTLAESQRKKAAFLQEAVRSIGMKNVSVYAGRAEDFEVGSYAAVWMRAVDRSAAMLPIAANLVCAEGRLCVLGTTGAPDLQGWLWESRPQPASASRVLHIGRRW